MDVPAVQYVRTPDGYSLAYWDVGSGPVLLLVPSRLNSLHQTWHRFGPWFRPLMERYRFVGFDARGQGLSSRGLRPGVAVSDFVDDLGLVIDHLGLRKVILISHGFGGHVAARYAAAHPERVAALVFATVTVDIRAWNMPFWFGVASENWELFLQSLAPRSLTGEALEEWLTVAKGNENHADYMLAQAAAASSRIDDVLPSLQAPALVLHPRNFVMVPEEEATRLASALANARLAMLTNESGMFLGDSTAFVAHVTAFVDEVSSKERSAPDTGRPARLSPRETEVLRLIAAGKSNQQIADALVLSLRTVERHITNLYAKIGAHGKADATAYALRHGLE